MTLVIELVAVAVIVIGVWLTFGLGPALMVGGALVLAGVELYGLDSDSDVERS
jgi:hypothetical protein